MPQPLSPSALQDYYRALYESTGECLIWSGHKTAKGYGQKRVKGRTRFVHRQVWEDANGPVPPGLLLRHLCDQPACYRLDHLEPGSTHGNAREAIERGLFSGNSGEENPMAKLTDEQVRAIRKSTLRQSAIARQYGITQSTVSLIRSRKAWRHVV